MRNRPLGKKVALDISVLEKNFSGMNKNAKSGNVENHVKNTYTLPKFSKLSL